MEHPTHPLPALSRAVYESHYLLSIPEGGWGDEDIRFSERAQRTLAADGPLSLLSDLFARHQREARRLNASELGGWPQDADARARQVAVAKLELRLCIERVESNLRRAGAR